MSLRKPFAHLCPGYVLKIVACPHGLHRSPPRLAAADTEAALQEITTLAQHRNPTERQAALLLQAAWAHNEQQANGGLIPYAALKGREINLLAAENSGKMLAANPAMNLLADGNDESYLYTSPGTYAVFGFLNKRRATFSQAK